MMASHALYKEARFDLAYAGAQTVEAPDWSLACREWLDRRAQTRLLKVGEYIGEYFAHLTTPRQGDLT